jgi:serine/threonine-protein kinase
MGDLALDRERYDEAHALFGRAADIYRAAYGPHSGALGIEYGNLGSLELDRGDNPAAERYFRQALEAYSGAIPPGHLDIAIARVKLGRALLRQKRYAEAERSTRAGYEVLVALTDPSISFLRAARKDLIQDYTALGLPDTAARFRAELADTTAQQ